MRFKKTIIIFLIILILLNISLVYAINANKNNESYFRVHIVANSDSIDDQLLKYTLSKQVNEYIDTLTINATTKQECKAIVQNNMQNILTICDKTLKDNNSNYSVRAYLGKQLYEQKKMDNIYMNSGIYDSLKIVIGNGLGQNWWSLIYPTTFVGYTQEELLDKDTTFSFKIVELIQDWLL